jgi:Domain of unknown function (DUF4129)
LRTIAHIPRLAALLMILGFPSALWSRPADSQAPNQPLSLQEYIAELRTASATLDGRNPAAISAFRRALPNEWVVQVDQQSMKVETGWLAAALLIEENDPAANPGRLLRAQQHLAALREAAEALAMPAAGADLGQARAQIDGILRDREFQGSHEPSWLDRLEARIQAWISRQYERFFGRIGIPAPVGSAIAWTLVLLASLLVAFWGVRSWIAAASRADMDLRGGIPAGQDWRYWAAQARAAAERGDYRAAIHAAYWTAVARLEENHLLSEDRSRTPRESLRLVQRANAAYTPLAQLTRRFELTWYGYHPATSADWDDAMQQLETLECLRPSTEAIAGS